MILAVSVAFSSRGQGNAREIGQPYAVLTYFFFRVSVEDAEGVTGSTGNPVERDMGDTTNCSYPQQARRRGSVFGNNLTGKGKEPALTQTCHVTSYAAKYSMYVTIPRDSRRPAEPSVPPSRESCPLHYGMEDEVKTKRYKNHGMRSGLRERPRDLDMKGHHEH